MTVKDLIEWLKQYPEDMEIVDDYRMFNPQESFKVLEDWTNGDSANLNNKILHNVLKIN